MKIVALLAMLGAAAFAMTDLVGFQVRNVLLLLIVSVLLVAAPVRSSRASRSPMSARANKGGGLI